MSIIAYLIDSSQYGEEYGDVSNVLRAIGMLISSFQNKEDSSEISESAGELYEALLAMGDLSGYSTETLLEMYEASRNELINRGVIE